jgi:hypothetical protein
MFVSGTKNPVLVEAGRRGARRRWGEPRHVNLADVDADTRRLILALMAQATEKAAPTDENVGAAKEVRRASVADSSSE